MNNEHSKVIIKCLHESYILSLQHLALLKNRNFLRIYKSSYTPPGGGLPPLSTPACSPPHVDGEGGTGGMDKIL